MRTLITCLLYLLQGVPGIGIPQSTGPNCGSPVSGSQFWFSADCITYSGSVCSVPSNGSSVTVWNDRSGNTRDATTASGTLTFSTSQINSLPAVTSTGSAWATIGGSAIGASDTHSIFVVWKNTSASGARGLVGGVSGVSNSIAFYTNVGGSFGLCYDTTFGTFGNCSTTGTTQNAWTQGNLLQSGPASGSGALVQFRIARASSTNTGGGANLNTNPPTEIFTYAGATNTFTGGIAEIIYYNSVLNGGDVTTNETYLNCRYGI